jgi:hypothetical protein
MRHNCIWVYSRRFPTEEIANVHCIDYIIRYYNILVALVPFDLNEVESQGYKDFKLFKGLVSVRVKLKRFYHDSYLGQMQLEED